MGFCPAPPLPNRFAAELPFTRAGYELETGRDLGREIHYIDDGDRQRRPVVFFHGNPTWCFLWRKVIAGLAPDRYRRIAPDLLGFGLSSRLPAIRDHDVDRHADALAELLGALDLHHMILVGQDWGGPMAACVGARMPDRVAGVVLANTSVLVPTRPRGTAFHRFARAPIISDLVFRGLGFPQNMLWIAQGDPLGTPRSIRGRAAAAYRWPLRSFADRAGPLALARMVPDGPDHPSIPGLVRGRDWITTFDGPMALVWGIRDPILGRALRRHRHAFPRAPVTLTEAGHFLQEQVPEAIAAAIEDVAGRASAGSAREADGA